jgi:feruloyl esterase
MNIHRLRSLLLALLACLSPTLLRAAPAGPVPRLADLAALRPAMECAALANADVGVAVGAKVTIASARLYPGAQPFCGVRGTIAPQIGFAVKLPTAGWTQRFLQLGCGGLCGMIAIRPEHYAGCAPVTAGQTVLASTDMGHGGGMGNDGSWGRDPQLRRDFAYRGVHLTALAAKALIKRFYGRDARYSYFMGCSDGGREALIEAQRFPADFNGIAAGAPAMNFLVQNTFFHAWQARSNTGPDGRHILLAAKLPALHRAALASCDAADGLADGQITDPRLCRFDPATAGCKPGQTADDSCLTPAEIAVARAFYEGPHDASGHRFTIGGPQVGSELSWTGVYVPDTADGRILSPGAALSVIKYLAFPKNPPETITLADFRFDQATFARLAALYPLYDSTNPDLAPFKAAGGKLILYHGWSDPHISPINTIAYFQGVQKQLGAAGAHDFSRLFLFPGMYHCGGGDGPAEFDILTPLMAWVEGGTAPDMILAGRRQAGEPMMGHPGPRRGGPPPGMMGGGDPFGGQLGDRLPERPGPGATDRTRPVYAFPRVARYSGRGSPDDAVSFAAGPPLVPPGQTVAWQGDGFFAPYAGETR